MPIRARLAEKIAQLDPRTREVLFELVDTLEEELATRATLERFIQRTDENFQRVWEALSQLSQSVRELAEAQKATEHRLDRLEQVVQELVEAQKRSEERMNRLEQTVQELAEAQKRTEEEIRKLARGQERNRKQIGSLSRTLAYELENEAFRYLPALLFKRYGFRVEEAFVRTEVEGLEVNLLARARREDGKAVMIVGEAVLRLDDAAKIRQVERRMEVVQRVYGMDVFPVIVCHYAPPRWKKRAEDRGIAVIQSYEWARPVSATS